jgi:hypothetical protein
MELARTKQKEGLVCNVYVCIPYELNLANSFFSSLKLQVACSESRIVTYL